MDTMIDPGKQTNSLQGTSAADAFRARTEKAQSDLLYVLEYLAQRPAQRKEEHVKEEEIEAAAELCSKPMDQLSDAEKKHIWSLIDALSHKIAPATVEGLRQCKETIHLTISMIDFGSPNWRVWNLSHQLKHLPGLPAYPAGLNVTSCCSGNSSANFSLSASAVQPVSSS